MYMYMHTCVCILYEGMRGTYVRALVCVGGVGLEVVCCDNGRHECVCMCQCVHVRVTQ